MKLKSVLVITLSLIALSIPNKLEAQTTFTQGNVVSTAQAAAFEYKLYQTIPTTPIPTTTFFFLTPVTCTGTPPLVNCSAPTPATLNKATGIKFELTARDTVNNTTESVKSPPFLFPATAPTIVGIQ